MQEAGFNVEEKLHENMNPIKQNLGVKPELASCHTAEINGFVFEGHIPADDIKAFLDNPPKNAKGLAVPGMPMGSPGMEYGDKKDEYSVYAFNEKGQVFEYRHYKGN
ncbi:CopG protein [Vibrio sp. 16]|nr:CopG protein [Vibrio sp. 16]